MEVFIAVNIRTRRLLGAYEKLAHAKCRVSQRVAGEWVERDGVWCKGDYRIYTFPI